ncbi:MAG: hypothetical protein K0M45_02685 [Candidatus Paracaedibacteraceae bacterium]|nr:hypothetical protein [Candidatus Paracaedibacteraceae bacterium]
MILLFLEMLLSGQAQARPGNYASIFSRAGLYHRYGFFNLVVLTIQAWIPAQGRNEGDYYPLLTVLLPGKQSAPWNVENK